MTIVFNLAAIAARVPFVSVPFADASLRIDWIESLLSRPSMSGVVGAEGKSVAGVSVVAATSTSITDSTSGAVGDSGAVGAKGSGSIDSVGAVSAGDRMPIASVPNCASIAALNVPI